MNAEESSLKAESRTELKAPPRYEKNLRQYILFAPFVVLVLGIHAIFLILTSLRADDLIPVVPGATITDLLIIFIILPMLSYLAIALTPVLAMLYLYLYKLIFRSNKVLFLDLKAHLGKWSVGDVVKRAIVPGLLACSLAQVIVNTTGTALWVTNQDTALMVIALFNAGFVSFPLVVILLMPLWLLFDAGVMSQTNPDLLEQKRLPRTVEVASGFFYGLFRGFSGVAIVLNFISIVFQALLQIISPLMILFVLSVPFLGIALIIPGQAIYEQFLLQMIKMTHQKTGLHGVPPPSDSEPVEECPACSL
ncbi:MAG: hypothetical protein ACFFC7_10330 [Candidatus Hermodarchaeota archaeon]